jgi:nitric oxide synthase oxygenase domain/subunit
LNRDFFGKFNSLVPPISIAPPFANGHHHSDTSTVPTYYRHRHKL